MEHSHCATPTLQVADPRCLTVKTVQFHRREAADPVESRINQQEFDAVGRPIARRDPRLFGLAQDDQTVPSNLRQIMSLSGASRFLQRAPVRMSCPFFCLDDWFTAYQDWYF